MSTKNNNNYKLNNDDDNIIQIIDLNNLYNICIDIISNICIDILHKDIDSISCSNWTYILCYIQNTLFKNNNILKCKNNINNAFDIDTVTQVYMVYRRLCNQYDKEVNLHGFSDFSGVSREAIYSWGASPHGMQLFKTIQEDNERSLSDLMQSTTQPMRYLPKLNKYHGWDKRVDGSNLVIRSEDFGQIAQDIGLTALMG